MASLEPSGKIKTSAFLALPGEIRNAILRLLLTHTTQIVIYHFRALEPPRPVTLNLQPNILRGCKQIYNEGRAVLYSENIFQAHYRLLKSIVFAIDPARLVMPKCIVMIGRFHIRVRADIDAFYLPSECEAAFSGMDYVEVEVFRSSFEAGGHGALRCFAGVRGVNKAKVHGSVDEHVAKWLEKCMMSKEDLSVLTRENHGFGILEPGSLDTRIR